MDLFAIVCHCGDFYGGHYWCYAKTNNGKWYKYDDASVTEQTTDFIKQICNQTQKSGMPYLLFYRTNKATPAATQSNSNTAIAPIAQPETSKKHGRDEATVDTTEERRIRSRVEKAPSGLAKLLKQYSYADVLKAQTKDKNLKGAKLAGADLSGLDLSGVDFTDAILTGAHLEKAKMNKAIFVRAHMEGTHLEDAEIKDADFTDAHTDEMFLHKETAFRKLAQKICNGGMRLMKSLARTPKYASFNAKIKNQNRVEQYIQAHPLALTEISAVTTILRLFSKNPFPIPAAQPRDALATAIASTETNPSETALDLISKNSMNSFLLKLKQQVEEVETIKTLAGCTIQDSSCLAPFFAQLSEIFDPADYDLAQNWDQNRDESLVGAKLGKADLRNCILDGADLRYANLTGANLAGASLIGADLTGAILVNANLKNTKLKRVNFSNTILLSADFESANAQEAKFINVWADGAAFKETNLNKALFQSCILCGTGWDKTRLNGAIFNSIIFSKFNGDIFSKSFFSNLRIQDAYFRCIFADNCVLTNVGFCNSEINCANFSDSSINGFLLNNTTLYNIKFLRAKISNMRCDGSELIFHGINFEDAILENLSIIGGDCDSTDTSDPKKPSLKNILLLNNASLNNVYISHLAMSIDGMSSLHSTRDYTAETSHGCIFEKVRVHEVVIVTTLNPYEPTFCFYGGQNAAAKLRAQGIMVNGICAPNYNTTWGITPQEKQTARDKLLEALKTTGLTFVHGLGVGIGGAAGAAAGKALMP